MQTRTTQRLTDARLVHPARLTVSLIGCGLIVPVSLMRFVLSSFVFVTVLQPLAAADETPQLVVRQGDFVKNLTFSGDLTTQSVLTVMVPRISSTSNFVISYLAPQGTTVRQGDLLVQLDAPELSTELLVLERQREDARTQVAQKEADLEAQYQDLLLILEIAKSQKEKAALFTQIDPTLIPRADVEQYQFDFDQAAIRVEKTGKSLETFEKSRESELAVVRLERAQADLQFKRLSLELLKLTIRAPNPGLVIHDNNPMREGQFQTGDMVWTGLNLLYLPDMQNPRVRAYVYDEDFPLLKAGMKAQVTFDGLPHKIFEGRVDQLPSMARPREFHTLLTAFPVEISLQVGEDDVGLLRPGGTARVLVPVVQQNALVIPRAALHLDPDGSVFVRTQAAPDLSIPVQVLDASPAEVSISGDVQPGERLLRTEPAASASAHSEIKWIPVKRQNLTFSVSGSGQVRAEKAVTITAPLLEGHERFEITYLASEGVAVEQGELLIAFDASHKETRLREEIARLQKVQEEARQTEATLRLQVQQLEMQLEEAGAELTRMETKLQQARQFESGLIIIEARLDADLGRKKVELLKQKLHSVRIRVELQIKTVHVRAALHQRRVARQRDDIKALSVRAPISGVVVYSTNSKNQKKQVGSEVRRFGQVLELPDLTTLVVQGQVAEVDSGRIRTGQEVEIRLEGVPNQIFSGRIADLGKIFNRISYERPGRVLKIKIELDHSGNPRVRHGMAAQFLVISERFENVLALALTSIQLLAETLVRFDETDATLALEQGKNQLATQSHRIENSTLRQAGEMRQLGMDQRSADLERSYSESQVRKDETIFSQWEIRESLMNADLAESRLDYLKDREGLQQELGESLLRELNVDKSSVQAEVELAREALSSLSVKSPAPGVIVYRRLEFTPPEVGSTVWPGQQIMEISSADRFRAMVALLEADIGRIEEGNRAEVVLSSFPGRKMTSRIESISRVARQFNRKDLRKYFECSVLVDVGADATDLLKPGMDLEVSILVEQFA